MKGGVTYSTRSGFTLVELAIVLVILGLLVGGVLVGQSLIGAGKIRQQVAQLDKFNAGTNAFRDKYLGLPGDLKAATASGFAMTARSGAAGHGDGNGLIEGCAAGATIAGCETILYWSDLRFAGLVDGAYTTATDAAIQISGATTPSMVMPPTSIGASGSVAVYTSGSRNYYQLTTVSSTDAAGVYTLASLLTPNQAGNIDSKLDDGAPATGVTQAVGGTGPLGVAAVTGATACATSATQYNTASSTYADSMLCQLAVQFK